LLLLVIIPVLAAVALGGIRIASSVQSAFAYQRVVELANLNGKIIGLVQALQSERQDTITFITLDTNGGRAAALSRSSPLYQSAQLEMKVLAHGDYAASSRSAAQVKSLLGEIGTGYSELTQQEARAAIAAIDGLGPLRKAATGSRLPPLAVIQEYTDKINTLLALDDQVAVGSSDSALADGVRVAGLVSDMKEEASEERALITAAQSTNLIGLSRAGFPPDIQAAITTAVAQQQANEAQFNGATTASQRQLFDTALSAPTVAGAQAQVQQAISLTPATSPGAEGPVIANAESSLSDVTSGMRSVEKKLVDSVIARSIALRNNTIADVIIWGSAILLVLVLAFLATVAVGRSMIRPLRRLRTGALDVAGVRLPQAVSRINETDGAGVPQDVVPIDVDSTDEIGEVARAFDQVHREAVRLASNEAALRGNVNAMFVNLSRRSQSLVERQIRLIDDLEQGEQDSERLGNLFQMDHLATRMRRNSENLLVLAGHEVSRRWTQAVGLVDVLRAAVSEIEQYERVTLNVQPGIAVRGQAVSDVVHLLAELAENATSFSAADTPVAVSGHLLNSGGVLLDITDQGVGMGAEEMAHANWRLDNPPVVDVAVSRRMGLFVVARLAARHGIRVRLRPASMGGLTALVWLPDEVISFETAPVPAGLRRFETASTAAASSPAVPAMPSADSGVATAPAPENGHLPVLGAPPSASATVEADEELAPGLGDVTLPSLASELSADVIMPPAPSAAEESRLPIFESVESDWFRRSRHGAEPPATAAPMETWSSPADEGWRAAEVAQSPVSGGTTAAGLPVRVPKANLVPGTVSSEAAAPPPPAPARSAAQAQERLASFQRGIRNARAAAQDTNEFEREGEPGDEDAGATRQADLFILAA
jgi:signal transduction histidine kinase